MARNFKAADAMDGGVWDEYTERSSFSLVLRAASVYNVCAHYDGPKVIKRVEFSLKYAEIVHLRASLVT